MEMFSLLLLTLFGYAAVAVPVRDSIPLIEDRKLVSSYSTNVGKTLESTFLFFTCRICSQILAVYFELLMWVVF